MQMMLYKRGLMNWVFFGIFVLFVFMFISSKDASFTLTVSSMFQVFGFFMILFMYLTTKSLSGISLHSLICYLVVYIFRTIAIFFEPGFLPEDSSGDWFYHVMELGGALITIALIVIMMNSTQYYTESHFDSVKCYYPLIVAFFAALIIRPALSHSFLLNLIWIFAFYTETFAIIPQLMFFVKKVF